MTSGGSMQGSGNTVRLKNNYICSGDDIDVDGDLLHVRECQAGELRLVAKLKAFEAGGVYYT